MAQVILDPETSAEVAANSLEQAIEHAKKLRAAGHHVRKIIFKESVLEGADLQNALKGSEPPPFENFPR